MPWPRLRFFVKHVQESWKYWAGAGGFLVFLYEIYTPLKTWVEGWLVAQVVPPTVSPATKFALREIASTAVSLLIVLTSVILVIAIYSMASLYKAKRAGSQSGKREAILLKTFHRTQQAADLILNRLFPGSSQPMKQVIKCQQIWAIFENGDCSFTENLVLTTAEKDIHFIEKGQDAEPEADPVEFPDDMDFKIESNDSGSQIAYLINKNEARHKKYIVFFLPYIKAGGKDVRGLTTTFYWPGLARGLVTKKEEPFSYQIKSAGPVPEVEYQFWVKTRMGHLECTSIGPDPTPGTETLVALKEEKGMSGWKYVGCNLPVNHVVSLRLELKVP